MDTDLLVAKLLLRGFKKVRHPKDDSLSRRMYQNGEVIISVYSTRAIVAARLYSTEEILEMTDHAVKKANGDRHD